MPGGPDVLKALIVLTLVVGALSLGAWLRPADRPGARRQLPSPMATPGRVVGAINAPRALATFQAAGSGGSARGSQPEQQGKDKPMDKDKAPADTTGGKVTRTESQWRSRLTDMQYKVTRCSATEAPFTGKYWNHHERGVYVCVGCGQELFRSDTKYDSGTGWPSYFQPASPGAVTTTWAWSASRSAAAAATPTWATSSRTARGRPGCGTASTRRRWTSTRPTGIRRPAAARTPRARARGGRPPGADARAPAGGRRALRGRTPASPRRFAA